MQLHNNDHVVSKSELLIVKSASFINRVKRLPHTLLTGLLLGILLPLTMAHAQADEQIIDNNTAQFSVTGTWPISTYVLGYQGADYQTHAANGVQPDGIIVDNTDAGFSVTGTWPISTYMVGYQGSNYQYHVTNTTVSEIVIDNLDSHNTTVGTWVNSVYINGYEATDYQTHAAGTGSASFTWVPVISTTQSYQVYAKWTTESNRATDAKYTIQHSAGSNTITVNQQQNGATWNLLGTYTLDAASKITLKDDANGYVIADAIKLVPVTNTATWAATLPISGDYQVFARWTASNDRPTNAKYTIKHSTGSTTVNISQQQNGSTWNLLGTYQFNAGATSVSLTDQANNNYVIADAVMFVPFGSNTYNTATWTPIITNTQSFVVYAKWPAETNRATNAKYTIKHSTGSDTVTVNQQQNGAIWNLLGTYTLNVASNISLSDEADGYVIADAIRLVSNTTNTPPTVTLTSPSNGASYNQGNSISFAATAADSDGTIVKVEFYDGSTLIYTATTAPYSIGVVASTIGTHTVTAVATDNTGATTTSNVAQVTINAASNAIPQAYYIHTDQLNTPRLITDNNNQAVWRWDNWEPFGNYITDEDPGNTGNKFTYNPRFAGQYYDAETGLSYNYFRDYNPQTGRYLQSDPIGLEGGINTYAYVKGNPISYLDSTGLVIDTIWDIGNVVWDIAHGEWGDAAADATAMCVPFVPAGVTKLRNINKIHWAKQQQHIPGHPDFIPGKSELTANPEKLLDKAGTGTSLGPNKERVDFGEVIGKHVDPATGIGTPTTKGIVHNGKSGSHVVPSRP